MNVLCGLLATVIAHTLKMTQLSLDNLIAPIGPNLYKIIYIFFRKVSNGENARWGGDTEEWFG